MDSKEIRMGGSIKECCKNPANLRTRPEDQKPGRPDIIVQRCNVCKCRHIGAVAEPGRIGLRGGGM